MRTSIGMEWRPVGTKVFSGLTGRRLTVGDVIAWEWAAWRVEHVQDAIPTGDEERYAVSGRGPCWVSLRRLHGPSHPKERDIDPGLNRVADVAMAGRVVGVRGGAGAVVFLLRRPFPVPCVAR